MELMLATYINGNTAVQIHEDGTKIREYHGSPYTAHPESIDIKITDYCDMGCLYCHESSTKKGKHGNISKLLEVLKSLPAGVELAIGGGNPLSHPDLITFLYSLKKMGIISNLTVNQGHLKTYFELLSYLIKEDLIKGLGISITNNNFAFVSEIKKLSNNVVYHLIAGINKIDTIKTLIGIGDCKILLLGYKHYGFGVAYHNPTIDLEIKTLKNQLRSLIGKCVLSFDNLAIEQLEVRKHFTNEGWERFYMGDDFTFTMYIDGVKEEFAPTSRSNERQSFNNYTLFEYFQKYKG